MNVQDRRYEVLCYLEESITAFIAGSLREWNLEVEAASAIGSRIRDAVAEKFGGFTYYTRLSGPHGRQNSVSLIDARDLFRFASDEVAAALVALDFAEADAAFQAARLGADISTKFDGQSFYLPRQRALKLGDRNSQLMREFNGKNQIELARKFGVGLKQVYKIIQSDRKRHQVAARGELSKENS